MVMFSEASKKKKNMFLKSNSLYHYSLLYIAHFSSLYLQVKMWEKTVSTSHNIL